MTILAMPLVLDGERSRVDITGHGVRHRITLALHVIEERPVHDDDRTEGAGSEIRLYWPRDTASGETGRQVLFLRNGSLRDLDQTKRRLTNLVNDFAFMNPHATLILTLFGETYRSEATDPAWGKDKWVPSSPTSPHWYELEHLERLLSAYVNHDRQNGRDRTVREFASEFRGLSGSAKLKQLLDDLGLARASLSSLLADDGHDFDHERVAGLLGSMKELSKPVQPKYLGPIGSDRLEEQLTPHIEPGSFEYKHKSTIENGIPQVVEVAFGVKKYEASRRSLITGVNWSATWRNPFRNLADGKSLDSLLEERRFQVEQPIVLLVHVAHPRVTYLDRGKSSVQVRSEDVIAALDSVGRKWTRQIKAEEKHAGAHLTRSRVWAQSTRVTFKDVCEEHMEEAWNKASDSGRLPTFWRQVFYVMRPICALYPELGSPLLGDTFRNYLDEYIERHQLDWDVLKGPRGGF